ncbi:hypothetical protein [Dyella sp. 2RAB6]|uniref:hypothetical protein n=1 Tax=Dyella sp. 2RAB6 TaxID=3232992 RepID=UPI003F920EC8
MYTINQIHSLYFHPHKLHFSPVLDAVDGELRHRWLPGHETSPRTTPAARQIEVAPTIDQPQPKKGRKDMDSVRMDDDGASSLNIDIDPLDR